MIHKDLIPFEMYTDDFQVPYLAKLAETLRNNVKVTGVRNCFLLETPCFLPGELTPIQLLFQRKADEEFECNDNGTIAGYLQPQLGQLNELLQNMGISYKSGKFLYTLYADNNLKEQFLKFFQFFRIWQDESDESFYGIQFPFHLSTGEELCLYISENVKGEYFVEQEFEFQNVEHLCQRYDIQQKENLFYITLPNVHTQYSIRRLLDFLQFIFLSDHMI